MRRVERHLVPFIPQNYHHRSASQIHPIVQWTFQRGKTFQCKGGFVLNTQTGSKPTYADPNDYIISPHPPKPTTQGPPRSRSFESFLRPAADPTVLPSPSPNLDSWDRLIPPESRQPKLAADTVPATELRPLPHNVKRRKRGLAHLTMEDIDRIRELRFHEDPRVRKDRIQLARMFGVPPLYVGLIAPLPEDQKPVWLAPKRHKGKKRVQVEEG